MTDFKDKDKTVYQVGEHEFLATPCLDAQVNIVMDPASEGLVRHICMRRPMPGPDGKPAEALTMGRISWDVSNGRFFCEYCATHDMEFEPLWEIWKPSDIATA